jgi:outer membrane protein TolC
MTIWRVAAIGFMLTLGGRPVLAAPPASPAPYAPAPTPALPPAPPPGPGTVLTWDDCVRLAIKENPDLQSSREGVLNSDAVRMGAYSALYPQISASFSDNRSYRGATLYSPYVYSTSYQEQISLSQTIFNGFATKGNIDQARAQLNLAFANLDSEKATVSYNLKASFAQLLYAQKLVKISQNVIDIQQGNARLVKLLYEGGSEDKGNMELSQANLDQALYSLDQAIRTRDLSGVQLGVYIGQNLTPPVVAEGDLLTDVLPTMPDFNKLAVLTPAYFQHKAEVDAAAAGITIATSGWYPTVTASASAYRADPQFPIKDDGWSAGFTVSYPIFEGGATYFDVKAADASFRQALDNLRSGTNDAALTLAQMFKSMVDQEDNVRIQQELLNATALRYKIAEADYRNGLMSFQDFNTITESYVGQLQTLLSAQLSAVLAEASWEQARGLGAIP